MNSAARQTPSEGKRPACAAQARIRANRIRSSPPICLLAAVMGFFTGRLRFEKQHLGACLAMEDGQKFHVFRHLAARQDVLKNQGPPSIFVVRFRFARLSGRLNRLLSLVPVLLIGGFPGFRSKVWMENDENGFWQGVYEMGSAEAIEAYRGPIVFRMMNRRAVPDSISWTVSVGMALADYIGQRTFGVRSCFLTNSGIRS